MVQILHKVAFEAVAALLEYLEEDYPLLEVSKVEAESK
jgi:hypothetical protein